MTGSRSVSAVAIAAISCLVLVERASSQCALTKLVPGDQTENPELGFSVATDGENAVAGSPRDSTHGTDAGAAYVSRRSGMSWSEPEILLPVDGAAFDSFGTSVAIHGNFLAVGAPGDDDIVGNGGAVYVFERLGTSWVQHAKIRLLDAQDDDEFGLSVAIHGDYLVAGARTDDAGLSSGSAFVFRRSGPVWIREAELKADDAVEGDQFGLSVSVWGSAILVGARLQDEGGDDAGAAYVFRKSGVTWVRDEKLLASDAAAGDEFGISVALDGDYAAIGARLAEQGIKNNAGAVYVFHRLAGDWVEESRIGASDGDTSDQFGIAVGLRENHLIVGAWQDADAGRNTGAAYTFERKGTVWTETMKLTNFLFAALDEFGFSVAAGGHFGIVGIPGDDGLGTRTGSANVYAIGGDCNHNAVPDICDILEGVALDINLDGIPDECPANGDFDSDGDIDLFDLSRFQNCFTGSDGALMPSCLLADIEPDEDADLADFAHIQPTFTGP